MSIFRKLSIVAGLSTALIAGGSTLVAMPASAGVNCPSGNHCVFFTTVSSARHAYFNTDGNFSNDTFNTFSGSNGLGAGATVDNNSWAASNSSTGGFESHYFDGFNNGAPFLFCVNPGRTVHALPTNLRDRASSLQLRGTTSVPCLEN